MERECQLKSRLWLPRCGPRFGTNFTSMMVSAHFIMAEWRFERMGNYPTFEVEKAPCLPARTVSLQTKNLSSIHLTGWLLCRGDRIRTDGLADPNGALYQAELHPERPQV
jgi:hypothetical protein